MGLLRMGVIAMRRVWTTIGLSMAAACLFACFSSDSRPKAGGYSNWLQACERQADCDQGSCVCGICTATCDGDAPCGGHDREGVCIDPGLHPLASTCAASALASENADGVCFQACREENDCPDPLACRAGGCVSRSGLRGTGGVDASSPEPTESIDAAVPDDRKDASDGSDATLPDDEPVDDGGVDATVPVEECAFVDAGAGLECDGCPDGSDRCDGMCIPVDFDADNCGGCGVSCADFLCDDGRCRGATGFQQRIPLGGAADGEATHPRVAADASGNVLVAWTQRQGAFLQVWAARYEVGTGAWLPAERVGQAEFDSAFDVQVASAHDRAIVAWLMQSGMRVTVHARWLDWSTGSWSATTEIPDQTPFDADSLALAATPDGDAMLTWREQDGCYFARYDGQAGAFLSAQPFAASIQPDIGPLAMHAHDSGDITIAWVSDFQVHAARYDRAGGAWGVSEAIDSVNPGSTYGVGLARAPSDGVAAMWTRDGRVWWTRYNGTAGAFELASLTRNGPTGPYNVNFGIDESGVGHMAYIERGRMWWKHYDPGTDRWSDAEALELPAYGFRGQALPLAVSASGDAVVGTATTRVVWGRFYDGQTGTATPAESLAYFPPDPVDMAVTMAGPHHAVFVWRQGGQIWAHRYE